VTVADALVGMVCIDFLFLLCLAILLLHNTWQIRLRALLDQMHTGRRRKGRKSILKHTQEGISSHRKEVMQRNIAHVTTAPSLPPQHAHVPIPAGRHGKVVITAALHIASLMVVYYVLGL
jgi:hypothetical protein